MAENPKLQTCSSLGELNQMGSQKISVSDRTDNLQLTSIESDSFIVDMESLSPMADKDLSANSRNKLQRSLSRKGGSQHREKKINSNIDNDGDPNVAAASASASPRGDLTGASTPEKPMMVKVGTTADHPMNPQVHHQITILAGNVGASNAESRYPTKKLSIRRSPPSWTIDPRKIFLFLATLSSMGTMLMIYFTLSLRKVNEDDNALNWKW